MLPLLITAAVVAAAPILRVDNDYTQPGQYSVGQQHYELVAGNSTGCAGEKCNVRAGVYFPQNVTGSFPIAIFAPGFGTPYRTYENWLIHLASWGYISIGHTPNDGFVDDVSHAVKGKIVEWLWEWAAQESQIVGSPMFGITDTTRVVPWGYSAGGKSGQLGAAGLTKNPEISFVGSYSVDPVDCPPSCIIPPYNDPDRECDFDADYPSSAVELVNLAPDTVMIVAGAVSSEIDIGPPCAPGWCSHEWMFGFAPSQSIDVVMTDIGHTEFAVEGPPPPTVDPCYQGGGDFANAYYVARNLAAAWADKTVKGADNDAWIFEYLADQQARNLLTYTIKK
eukprot:TRINITY_DN15051_c0_g1_i1.p1 TRINITY_DN15051_c0_g1~~TRINITY_DN15051_c0_g1_i1.p1  ORF type:complete len:344 (-),score=75.49 TRINITY_DN15051_c0_g1_i1:68-1078(-)